MHWILIIPEKPQFGPLLAQTLQDKVMPQKPWFESILGLYAAVTSWKKSKKLYALTFDNIQKSNFGLILNPFRPKQNEIFPKKIV